MKKLSDFKNEQGLELLADLMESAGGILSDRDVLKYLYAGRYLTAIAVIGKAHKQEAINILAYLNGVSAEEYEGTPVRMARELYAVLSDDDMKAFFTLPQNAAQNTSGGVTEATAETDEE